MLVVGVMSSGDTLQEAQLVFQDTVQYLVTSDHPFRLVVTCLLSVLALLAIKNLNRGRNKLRQHSAAAHG